jgi:hypothetical protein
VKKYLKGYFVIVIGFFSFCSLINKAEASVPIPSVQTFSTTASSINSHQAVGFTITIANGGSYSLLIPCVDGIKIKYSSGSIFTCGVKTSFNQTAQDAGTLFFTNLGGSTRTINMTVIPKDGGGNEYTSQAQNLPLTITPSNDRILSFIATTTVSANNSPIPLGQTGTLLSWQSQDIDGVNFQLSCNSSLRISSPDFGGVTLPCGQLISGSHMNANGSITLITNNSSFSTTTLTIQLLPSITSNPDTYDGTYPSQISVDIPSSKIPDPSFTSITASPSTILSGATSTISWISKNDFGQNFSISCQGGINVFSASNTSPLPCNGPAFPSPLASNTASFIIQNTTNSPADVIFTPYLVKSDGTYLSLGLNNVTIHVYQNGYISPTPIPSINPASPATGPVNVQQSLYPSTTLLSPSTVSPLQPSTQLPSLPPLNSPSSLLSPSTISNKSNGIVKITTLMKRGSRGNQVKSLQEFLSKETNFYPEKIVNGVYGPATERAVARLQLRYKLSQKGWANYGKTGLSTRNKINELSGR